MSDDNYWSLYGKLHNLIDSANHGPKHGWVNTKQIRDVLTDAALNPIVFPKVHPVQRFSCGTETEHFDDWSNSFAVMDEDKNGDWVRYEDYEALLELIRQKEAEQ